MRTEFHPRWGGRGEWRDQPPRPNGVVGADAAPSCCAVSPFSQGLKLPSASCPPMEKPRKERRLRGRSPKAPAVL